MTIGDRIRRARKRLNLRQEDVAEDVGVTKAAVSNWERDEDEPTAHHRTLLRRVLRVTYIWLLEGSGDPPAPDDVQVRLEDAMSAAYEAKKKIINKRSQSIK